MRGDCCGLGIACSAYRLLSPANEGNYIHVAELRLHVNHKLLAINIKWHVHAFVIPFIMDGMHSFMFMITQTEEKVI